MILLLVFLVFISFYNVKFSHYNKDYMLPSNTNSIKGVFAILILLTHLRNYIEIPNVNLNTNFEYVLDKIGQLMVAVYFFYSGFGILESYKKKLNYEKTFFKKRILKTLLHFDIAVLLYVVLVFFISDVRPVLNYLTCWIGATSVGNSNWFIFVILMLYVIVIISFNIVKKKRVFAVSCSVTIFSVILWVLLRLYSAGFWWYDTLMTFSAGVWFSCYYKQINRLLEHRVLSNIIIVIISIFFAIHYHYHWVDVYGITACMFVYLIAAISTKIQIGNAILAWLGTNAFSMYILQRLPMNILRYFNVTENYVLFTVLSIPIILIMAHIYTLLLNKLDKCTVNS